MLKDKIERLQSRERNPILLNPGHCGVEVNERDDSEAKQSIKQGRDGQLLLLVADLKVQWEKAKRNFTVSVKTPKGTE
jgi:hypothetical protein